MFYWFFPSRRAPDTDPLIFWLTGGPGCSSEVALFYENGPFSINDDLTLTKNAWSWSEVSNIVFVDNPVGTGFSDCVKFRHLAHSEDQIAESMFLFLQGFLE